MAVQSINQTLPQVYKQYHTIIICGNTFNNVKYLIDDNGFIPLLIGAGDIPRLWMYTRKDNNAIAIVKDSLAIHPAIKVNIINRNKSLTIEVSQAPNSEPIKMCDIDFSNEIPNINQINLRPLGYNVYGDNNSLFIGEQKLTGNHIENLQSLIKIEQSK
ncbi:MAG: hypothetical protein Q8909_02320 [Bacteroidota bacterium]|nr:hypothetical protein [Bacteroidota bacterium]